jgi:predicted dehydrogenase
MSWTTHRRHFLASTAAVSAGYWLGTTPSQAADSPNNKLNLAVIGIGGRGSSNLGGVKGQNIVALVDVDEQRAGKAFEQFPTAERFQDFRKMFDKLENKIDGVVISTPDHTHFHPAYWAMQRGKHVYLEKPLAHNVWEVRTLTKMAAEKKLATQLGSQRHTLEGLRNGVEIVKSGILGEIKEVHSWVGSSRGLPEPLGKPSECPKTLNWDLWLGPCADRPYVAKLAPYDWRFWWEFGTGEAGNWGCHILDIPFWALDLQYPTKVRGTGPAPDELRTPKSMHTILEYPATNKRGAVTLNWYQGKPPIIDEQKIDTSTAKGANNLFIGSKGMLLCGFDSHQLFLNGEKANVKISPTLPKSPGFYNEWINACRGEIPATCNFNYSGPMAETVLLANIAYREQTTFNWDAISLKSDNDKVNKYLREDYRKGWEIN